MSVGRVLSILLLIILDVTGICFLFLLLSVWMATSLGGDHIEGRKTAVINRTIDFLLWSSKKEDNNSITCESLIPWLRIVLTEKLYLIQEYAEYLDVKKARAASTVKGHLFDIE